jgi:hypothetical protein
MPVDPKETLRLNLAEVLREHAYPAHRDITLLMPRRSAGWWDRFTQQVLDQEFSRPPAEVNALKLSPITAIEPAGTDLLDGPDDVALTDNQLSLLAARLRWYQRLSEAEKKTSESSPASHCAASAQDAEPDPTDADTDPTN